MSEMTTLRAFDARLHAAFQRAGMAFEGMYTAPGANLAIAVGGYLERDTQVVGEFQQVVARRDEMEILNGDGLDLREGGRVFIEGVNGSGIGETWQLGKQISDDGSIAAFVVRRV